MVTTGFAKFVETVKKYAVEMYNATSAVTASISFFPPSNIVRKGQKRQLFPKNTATNPS